KSRGPRTRLLVAAVALSGAALLSRHLDHTPWCDAAAPWNALTTTHRSAQAATTILATLRYQGRGAAFALLIRDGMRGDDVSGVLTHIEHLLSRAWAESYDGD